MTPRFVLLVTGGRDYSDWQHVWDTLDRIHSETPITLLVEGGNRPQKDRDGRRPRKSVDWIAYSWAKERGIPVETEHADWSLGRRAGPIRNGVMLEKYKPDKVRAFPGGRGTADMVSQAIAAGITVVHEEDSPQNG